MTGRCELEAARWAERLAEGLDTGDCPRFTRWHGRLANADAYGRVARTRRLVASMMGEADLEDLRRETRARTAAAGRVGQGWWRAAAAAAVVLTIPATLWRVSEQPTDRAQTVAAAPVVYATAQGERRSVMLTDGSRLTLDTASKVQIAFTGSERHVRLDAGQALFEVAKNPARPFIVSADGRRVTALGTLFNVRLDADRLRVALIEGSVKVGARGSRAIVMTPDELLVARGGAVTVRRDPSAVAALTSWKEGLLVFQDRPLAEAVAEMNRYAPHPLVLGDADVGEVRISGAFRPEQMPAFLDALQIGFPVAVKRRGDGSTIVTKRG